MKIFILLILTEISLSFEDEPLRIATRVLHLDDDSKHTIPPNPTTPQTPPQDTGMYVMYKLTYSYKSKVCANAKLKYLLK